MLLISLNPNIQSDDINMSRKAFFYFFRNKKTSSLEQLQKSLSLYFNTREVFLTNSGRTALDLLLRSSALPKGSEIAVQAFTCSAAISPILWNGYKPLYIDVDDSWNLNPKDLEKKLSTKTKAVIVQHSFGYPADISSIKTICEKNNLMLIEDCAVSLGAEYENKPVGSFGNATILSFGRDKAISGFGGCLVINDTRGKLLNRCKKQYSKMKNPPTWWTFQQLIYPLIINSLLPVYRFWIGKGILKLLQLVRLLSLPYEKKELKGEKPITIGYRLPGELAMVVLNQWNKLTTFIQHRKKIMNTYLTLFHNVPPQSLQRINKHSKPSPLRFNLYMPDVHISAIIKKLRSSEVLYLGNWYSSIIDPAKTDLKAFQYILTSCPKAEKLAGHVINLPTHIHVNEKQAKKIVAKLKKYDLF